MSFIILYLGTFNRARAKELERSDKEQSTTEYSYIDSPGLHRAWSLHIKSTAQPWLVYTQTQPVRLETKRSNKSGVLHSRLKSILRTSRQTDTTTTLVTLTNGTCTHTLPSSGLFLVHGSFRTSIKSGERKPWWFIRYYILSFHFLFGTRTDGSYILSAFFCLLKHNYCIWLSDQKVFLALLNFGQCSSWKVGRVG